MVLSVVSSIRVLERVDRSDIKNVFCFCGTCYQAFLFREAFWMGSVI